ncbi:MAG TPA: ubiquinone/menaquinone biosynthesis methyltransferase [Anaerolineales bacterium]|nr:ubiquinone/menaquinone biosynthesis methyltransferase [Anaerolineales bacterium]
MASLAGEERARYVQAMFARIARRYDLMNRLMTAGQDIRWRREVVRRAQLPLGGRLLDLGAGTGDLAREARRQQPSGQPVAADFTLEMMRVGKAHPASAGFPWAAADALCLPFEGEVFDAVVSGFLMRNVVDLPQALREQRRVLRPGGRVVILDTTRPAHNLLSPFIRLHLKYVIPTLGRLVTGVGEAYTYLPDSTQAFLTAEQLAEEMWLAGFSQVGYRRLMFGTIAIHWGQKVGQSE